MTQKQRLLTVLMTLMLSVTGAWALDGSGTNSDPYQLGSVQDWKDFADIVNSGTNPAANAKMIADINLGTDQTRIGSISDNNSALHYQGVFDGQGHKLTVAYVETGNSNLCAPFTKLNNATIKNLHIAGTIQTAGIHGAGIASDSRGTTTIENIWVEASISSTHTGWDEESAFVGCMKAGTLNITDCFFTGTVTGTGSYNGCFVGYIDSGSATFTNCLSTGTFTGSFDFRGTHNNCYVKQFTTAIPTDMQVTDAELADGTTTDKLNNGRTGDEAVWVQQGGQPMLKTFALKTAADNYYLLANANDLKSFAALVNSGSEPAANARLIADIDLAGSESNQWTPIGTKTYGYNGTFDGQGFTISNLYYKQQVEGVGLFGYANNSAYIKNVRVEGTVDNSTDGAGGGSGGTQTCAGGIIGKSYGATVLNCSFSGYVISYSNVGGIVGWGTATIVNCYNEGTVMFHSTSAQTGGGVHGYDGSPQLINCYNVGNVINNGSSTFAMGSVSCSGSTSNCYSRSGCAQNGNGASWSNQGNYGTAMSADDMKGEAFVTTLNTNAEALRATYPDICGWALNSGGYPIHAVIVTAHEGATGEYWSTYYDGAKSSIADANTTVYTGKVNGDKIDLTEIVDKTIPAGNAVILKSTAANVTLTKTSATGTLANNDLKGVDVATAKTGVYCLSKNGTVVGFYKFSDDVPAHRAYIESLSSAPMLGLDDGETTEISTLNIERGTLNDGSWYTLDGRQLNAQPTRKGIYVRNGKKFIVK